MPQFTYRAQPGRTERTGRWRARYRDVRGREQAKHFDRKLDAVRWLAGVEVAMSRGEWVDPTLTRVRFGDWARTWLDAQVQLKPSTRERYDVALRCHVLPTWERVPLAAITHADVAAWVQQLVASGLMPGTVHYDRVLSLVLTHAVRDGRLARNVAQGVRLPRIVRGEVVFLDHEQVERLAAASGPYGLLVRVLAYTGLRWGEATALRVGRLDLFRRRVHVVSALAEVRGKLVEGTPKNHQVRWVPLPRFLVDELARHVAGLGPDELVFRSPKAGPAAELQLPRPVLRQGGHRVRAGRADSARPAAHGREPRRGRRRERQGGAADARPRLRRDDARRVRGPVRGRPGCGRRAA